MSLRHRVATAVLRRHAALRPLLPRKYHAYPGPGGWIYLDLRESPMMLARALRAYERPKVQLLQQVMRPGAVFVDIGGNKGDFSLIAARATSDDARILCFEPEPDNVAWIRRSVARNGYRSIEVVPVALSDVAGTATLHLGEKSGWHTLVRNADEPASDVIDVATITLDAALAARGIDRVDVLKLDVEGAEDLVLAGAQHTLRPGHPMTLLLDLHPGRGVDPVATCARLEKLGFVMAEPVTARSNAVTATR